MANPVNSPFGDYSTQHALPQRVLDWHQELPLLEEGNPLDGENCFGPSFNHATFVDIHEVKTAPKTRWERTRIFIFPRLATPCIIFGTLIAAAAMAGIFTALTGFHIPGMEFVTDHMATSILMSLAIIRVGLRSIYIGVQLSRRHKRHRWEAQEYERRLRIQHHIDPASIRSEQIARMHQLNWALAPSHRIENPETRLYSNGLPNLSSGTVDSFRYRQLLAEKAGLPMPEGHENFDLPEEVLIPDAVRAPKLSDKWYNFWSNRLTSLGVTSTTLGQIMLLVSIGAFVLLVVKQGGFHEAFKLIAQDPSLSVTFTLVLLINWINATRMGYRMTLFKDREIRRDLELAELQLIDLGLERAKIQQAYEWFSEQHDLDEEVEDATKALIVKIDTAVTTLSEQATVLRATSKRTNCAKRGIEAFGKRVVPKLATPSIILGVITTIVASTLLVMSITNHVPTRLAFLSQNTPCSILFSSGVLIAGLHSIDRGVGIKSRKRMEELQHNQHVYTDALLTDLFPQLEKPRRAPPTEAVHLPGHTELNLSDMKFNDYANTREHIKSFASDHSLWHRTWMHSLRGLWLPDMVLSAFLLTSSVMGLAIVAGMPAPEWLHFISADPHFSSVFCLGLFGIGVDAAKTSFVGMKSFRNKREGELAADHIMRRCYLKFKQEYTPHEGVRV